MEIIRERNKSEGKGLSIVTVAHRLSSIRSCDRIVVVDEGHIVEEGNHEELLSKNGIYAGLYKSQETGGDSVEEKKVEEKKKGISEQERLPSIRATRQHSSLSRSAQAIEDQLPDIPDEEPDVKRKNVSMLKLLQFVPNHKWLFFSSFIGNIARAIFPTVYAYCSAVLQELTYTYDLNELWNEGWVCVYILLGMTIINYLGTLYQWDAAGVSGEHMIMNIRDEAYKKYVYMPMAFFDEPSHTPSILTSRLSIDGRRVRDLVDRVGFIFENYLLVIISLATCFTSAGDWRLTLVALCISPFLLTVEYLQWMVIAKITDKIDRELTSRSGDLLIVFSISIRFMRIIFKILFIIKL